MKRKGIIYDANWRKTSGQVLITIGKWMLLLFVLVRILGSSLIVAGMAGMIITLQPVITSELRYRWDNLTGKTASAQLQAQEQAIQRAHATEEEQKDLARQYAQEIGLSDTSFALYIPKIQAKSTVVENVDPSNYKEYMNALSRGIAHARGSVLPGMNGGVYLFAHSTELPVGATTPRNAVFYLLKELQPPHDGEPGDEIDVFFLNKLYRYRVKETHIASSNDVSWLTTATSGPQRLILQTCWPPGTNLKRFVVIAEPVRE